MSLLDWVQKSKIKLDQEGLSAAESIAYEFYLGAWRRADRFISRSDFNIYDKEWDVLIILDGCRPDLFKECGDEYSFIEDSVVKISNASDSPTWMQNTFTKQYSDDIASTVYVSGNAFCQKYLDPTEFRVMDVVSNHVWDEDLETIPPRPITDRAIATYRDLDPDRMIIHYMQPHIPFIRSNGDSYERIFERGLGGNRRYKTEEYTVGENEWDLLRKGELKQEEFWNAFKESLRCVLDDVELLLNSISSDQVVLTADHGNAMGEHGIYGHPGFVPNLGIRQVPWCETSATDTSEYIPEIDTSQDRDVDIDQRLKDLGYL